METECKSGMVGGGRIRELSRLMDYIGDYGQVGARSGSSDFV